MIKKFGLQGKVNVRTVQRCIRKIGFVSKYRKEKPGHNSMDVKDRLKWAKGHRNCRFGKIDLYMDAKFFKMPLTIGCTRSRRVWVKHGKGEQLRSWAVKGAKAFKAPGAHILAGFSGKGRVLFAQSYLKMNKRTAADMFTRIIKPALRREYPNKPKHTVQMDGEPSFNLGTTLRELGIKKFEIPPRSGDLAIMETKWARDSKILEDKVMKHKTWKKGAKHTKAARASWVKFVRNTVKKNCPKDKAFYQALIKSQAKRVSAVIKNRGGPTRW